MNLGFILRVWLLLFLSLHCEGTLNFLNLASFSSLFRDDELSGNISTLGEFPFGRDTVYGVYVSTNGFISMGVRVDRISPEIPGTSSIVAPYAADIDPTEAGIVRHTQFTTDDYSQMSTVSSFIQAQTDEYFYGTTMMVAEWDGVAEYDGFSDINSTFQCVLITDGYASYAMFIYECGGMEWNGATIGWEYNDSLYQRHPFSGSNSADVGCAYSSSYSAVVYRLDSSGTLNFLNLTSFSSLFGDNELSSGVSAVGGFPFGRDTVYNVYVSTNGFISMGVRVNHISPEIPGTSSIVAPYAADIDPTEAGTVRYMQFTTDDYYKMSTVSSFIRARTNEYFYGSIMIVGEWNGVPEYAGSPNITSTFQCVLITDSIVSYAVFIYECGGMEWDGATIGLEYDDSLYQRHPFSGSNSSDVGCAYSSSYSAVVYRLDSSGTLNFLNLTSFSSLFGDNELSSGVSAVGGFPFGRDTVYNVYVSTNGFISMGVRVNHISPVIPGNSSIVAPYAANIDPTEAGTVRYTQFTTDDYSQMSTVSSFIQARGDEYFNGTTMMVAEWNGVPEYAGSPNTTSTFQCVLITDGYAPYAVFIYECGGMEWDGATIGWEYDDSLYQRHPFSGSNSADVGCAYSSSYSAVVCRLDSNVSIGFTQRQQYVSESEAVISEEEYRFQINLEINSISDAEGYIAYSYYTRGTSSPTLAALNDIETLSPLYDARFGVRTRYGDLMERHFLAGASSVEPLIVLIRNDVMSEEKECFTLYIDYSPYDCNYKDVGGFFCEQDICILDDDTAVVGLERTVYTVSEDDGIVEVCAIVTSPDIVCPIEFPFEVSLSTSTTDGTAGNDYLTIYTRVRFDTCDSRACVKLSVMDDSIAENDKTFKVTLEMTHPKIHLESVHGVVTIVDDDDVIIGFNSTEYTATETEEIATVCVSVQNPPALRPFSVALIPAQGYGTSGDDYTLECNGRLNFTTDNITQCYNYNITNDNVCELGTSQTMFKVELTLSTAGDDQLLVNRSNSVATVIIDDTTEPECNVNVSYNESRYTLYEGEESVEICVTAATPGISAEFVIDVTIDQVANIVDNITGLNFSVNSSVLLSVQCYNISVPMKDDCALYVNCTDITVNSQLSVTPFNGGEYVSLIESRRAVEVVVPLPDVCDCSTQSSILSSAGIAGITVSSFILSSACVVLILLVTVIFYKRRKKLKIPQGKDFIPSYEHHYYSLDEKSRSTLLQQLQEQLKNKRMIISKDQLQLSTTVGQGESGLVYKAYLNTALGKEVVAVKTGKSLFSSSDMERLAKEVSTMLLFEHTNVMSLIGVCIDGEMPLLVMPFMSNGSVHEYVKQHKEDLCLSSEATKQQIQAASKTLLGMCHQITKGMEYLSLQKFVHRDLAARNCMIDRNGVIKVADFGLTEDMYGTNYFRRTTSEVGSEEKVPIRWMAPESIENNIYDEATDVWAFGVTSWEIFTCGRIPYAGIHVMRLKKTLESGERLERPDNKVCQDEIYEIMKSCWSLDPHERPRFKHLVNMVSNILEKDSGYLELSLSVKEATLLSKEQEIAEEELKAEAPIELRSYP